MDVVILLIFVSLMLVAAGLMFFFFRLRDGDFDHGERLALAPLNNDGVTSDAGLVREPSEDPAETSSTDATEGGTQHGSR